MPRLDKVLSLYQFGSRAEVKRYIKNKDVIVNHEVISLSSFLVHQGDIITVGRHSFVYQEFVYYMMNKQTNRICEHGTDQLSIYNDLSFIYPNNLTSVGRLDKDTTGLLILTNDGQYNHKITSKNNRSTKRYLVTLQKPFQDETQILYRGVDLNKDGIVMAKSIKVIDDFNIIIGISDGKYHQVKRMIHAINNEVTHLHRLSIGQLSLDKTLLPGQCRPLRKEEIEAVYD